MLHPQWSHVCPEICFIYSLIRPSPRLWQADEQVCPLALHHAGAQPRGLRAAQKHGEKSNAPSILPFCFGLEDSVNLWSQKLL